MKFSLIVSQGRVADRTSGAIQGAALTAAALETLIGSPPRIVGRPAPAENDDWRASLPEARDTLNAMREAVLDTLREGSIPLVAANTCSASLATLPVVALERPDAAVLWIDAHGDFNTPETTGSGYLGGMVLAAACGLWDSGHGAGLNPRQVVLLGGRDIDPAEGAALRQAGVRVIPPAEATPEAVLDALDGAPVWIHLDWDALEPGFVPAAYKVPGGLLPGEVRAVLESLPAQRIAGVELAEFEASGDAERDAAAVATILDVVGPLLAAPAGAADENW